MSPTKQPRGDSVKEPKLLRGQNGEKFLGEARLSQGIVIFIFMHIADAFIQSDLQCIQTIIFFVSMCVPWESNPQPFALLTQHSTTEPQEHFLSFTQTDLVERAQLLGWRLLPL